jgi:hypothetical protein
LFDRIAAGLQNVGIRPEDLLISVVENGMDDWFAGKTRS